MSYAIVSTKVDTQTKKQAMAIAAELGMPLGDIIKAFLKQFIQTKTINFSKQSEEEPTEYMIESLRQSEEDEKAGRMMTFSPGNKVLEYLDKEILHEKRKHSRH